MTQHLFHDPHTPLQPELFSEEILRPCLEHERRRLQRVGTTFDEGWREGAIEARLAGRP